jgi:hypothetical protein
LKKSEHASGLQPNPHPEHHGYLTVMPAGVRGRRLGVGVGVAEHFERVQLANHTYRGAVIAGV